MHKRKRAGNTITRKINSTKDTAAKADKNPYISNSYLEGFIPIDTEYFTASIAPPFAVKLSFKNYIFNYCSFLWSGFDFGTCFIESFSFIMHQIFDKVHQSFNATLSTTF